MHTKTRWFAAATLLCILAGCANHKKEFFRRKLYFVHDKPSLQLKSKLAEPTITIWIHGARPFGANTYNLGLKSIDLYDQHNFIAQNVCMLIKADPINFPRDHFYIYGWTGILDFHERQHAADKLCMEIIKLLDEYKKNHGIMPKLRIMGHSHGGNVALNLATNYHNKFVVDQLILLGVPVQTKNQENIHSALFKRILNFYSTADIGQIIDPQLVYPDSDTQLLFSGQRFTPAKNLMQVKMKINGASCQHLQFNSGETLTIMPRILDELNAWMDTIPEESLLSKDTRFMLSVYTNGRHAPRLKRYYSGDPEEHKELPI